MSIGLHRIILVIELWEWGNVLMSRLLSGTLLSIRVDSPIHRSSDAFAAD